MWSRRLFLKSTAAALASWKTIDWNGHKAEQVTFGKVRDSEYIVSEEIDLGSESREEFMCQMTVEFDPTPTIGECVLFFLAPSGVKECDPSEVKNFYFMSGAIVNKEYIADSVFNFIACKEYVVPVIENRSGVSIKKIELTIRPILMEVY